jgi:hypothetical protein
LLQRGIAQHVEMEDDGPSDGEYLEPLDGEEFETADAIELRPPPGKKPDFGGEKKCFDACYKHDGKGWVGEKHPNAAEGINAEKPCKGSDEMPCNHGARCNWLRCNGCKECDHQADESTTTTTVATTTTTTTTTAAKVDENTQCQGSECIQQQVCASGTVTEFVLEHLKHNNLGGMGPNFHDPPVLHFSNVGEVDGRKIDMKVTTGSEYKAANFAYVWRYGYWSFTGQGFIKKYNGVLRSARGTGTIGTLKPGSFKFNFNFIYSDDQSPATLKSFPMTFYDVDGGKESLGSCDATSAVLHTPTGMSGNCDGCCKHQGARAEVPTLTNAHHPTASQKAASITYLFKDKDSVELEFTTNYPHRIFIFMGSKAIACEP